MNERRNRFAAAFFLLAGASLAARAATISWNTPENVSGDGDVPAATYGYQALNAAGEESVTVSGIIFSTAAEISLDGGSYTDFGDAVGLSSDYRKLLKTAHFDLSTITLERLKIGADYAVVVWSSDARSTGQGRVTDLDATVTLDENVGDQVGNPGQYVAGTFTADASTQTIAVSSSTGADNAVINAVLYYETNPDLPPQVGDVWTPPTPARWWKWHGGTDWAPNGIDSVYRIEEAWRGAAMELPTDGTPVYSDQFQTHPAERLRFESAGNDYWRIYRLSGATKYYLSSTGGSSRVVNLEINEVTVFDNGGNAISLSGATPTQSSTLWNNTNYLASKAIDGDAASFSSTGFESHPWFDLDLGSTYSIGALRFQVREFLKYRFRDAYVAVRDASNNTLWSTNTSGSRQFYNLELPSAVNGRHVYVEFDFSNDPASYLHATTGTGGYEKQWRIERMDSKGFYRIVNRDTGKAIQNPDVSVVDLMAEYHVPFRLATWNANDSKNMLWTIEPVRDYQIEALGVPQIGWAPKAVKYAVLTRNAPLSADPEFVVSEKISGSSDRRVVCSGYARYWGSNYSNLYFYVANLSELQAEGDYWIDCDGDRADVHVADDAYRNFRFRGGSRTTRLSEMFADTGFVGYWARLDNRTPAGSAALDDPYWMLTTDYHDSEHNLVPVSPAERIPDAYMAGWDHTDRIWNHMPPNAPVLRQLVFAWEIASDAALKEALRKEIDYGVDFMLNTQFPDGSWPLSTHLKNKLTGTVAAMASALAAARPVVATYDTAKAAGVLTAAKDGWDWIQAHPNDWVDISYRHGHAEDYAMLAIELYRITGDSAYGTVANDMISQAIIKSRGIWGKSGGTFDGENSDDRNTAQMLVSEMRYYPSASASLQTTIDQHLKDYYDYLLGRWHRNGAFGAFEGEIGGYAPNSKWVRRAAYFYRLYDFGGQNYGTGYYVAERIMDWMFGANPYATSCTYGFGDVFALPGWVRGYDVGSILPGISRWRKENSDPWMATTTHSTYGNAESEAGAGVALVRALEWRDALRNDPPGTVTLYPWSDYRGAGVSLPAGGTFNDDQLKAFACPLDETTSIRLSPGLSAILYDGGNMDGSSSSAYFSSPALSGFNNLLSSIRVSANSYDYSTWTARAGLVSPDDDVSADPDGDGRNNLQEYAEGTDPAHADAASFDGSFLANVATGARSLTYGRNTAAEDVGYRVESTPTLAATSTWTQVSGNEVVFGHDGTIEHVEVDLGTPPDEKRFYRVRAVKP